MSDLELELLQLRAGKTGLALGAYIRESAVELALAEHQDDQLRKIEREIRREEYDELLRNNPFA